MSFTSRPEEALLKKIKAGAASNNRSLSAEIKARADYEFEGIKLKNTEKPKDD